MVPTISRGRLAPTLIATVVCALAARSGGAASVESHRRLPCRAGARVSLVPPEVDPDQIWVEVSGPAVLLSRGTSAAGDLRLRPRVPGTYLFACLPRDDAPLARGVMYELVVGGKQRSTASIRGRAVVGSGETVSLRVAPSDERWGEATDAVWRQLSGPRLALDRGELRASVLRVTPREAGRYRMVAKVRAEAGWTPWASHVFEVPARADGGAGRRPVARVSASATARPAQSVEIDASGSYDPDGETLSFAWEKISGPPGQLQGDGEAVKFVPIIEGEYAFVLTVADPTGLSSPPEPFTITVARPPDVVLASSDADDPLDRPFSIRLEGSKLETLVVRLADAGVTVRASGGIAEAREFERTVVDFWSVGLPVRKVLDWMGRALNASYVVEKKGVVWFARGTRWLEREEPISITYRIDALHPDDDAGDLLSFLRECVRASLWARPDASLTLAEFDRELLTAALPVSAQRRIEAVLEELRRETASGPAVRPDGDSHRRLMLRPVHGSYDDWLAREVLWDLARQARVAVAWHAPALSRDRRIALELPEVPLRAGLDRAARAAGFSGYVFEQPGAVWLVAGAAPPETAECVWTGGEVRSYDTRMLEDAHGFSGAMLLHVVRSRVMPSRWEDAFAAVGYNATRRRLVVVHNPDVQRAVGAFLDRLSRGGEKALHE